MWVRHWAPSPSPLPSPGSFLEETSLLGKDPGQHLSKFPGSLLPARSGTSSPYSFCSQVLFHAHCCAEWWGRVREGLGGCSNWVRAARSLWVPGQALYPFVFLVPWLPIMSVGIEAPANEDFGSASGVPPLSLNSSGSTGALWVAFTVECLRFHWAIFPCQASSVFPGLFLAPLLRCYIVTSMELQIMRQVPKWVSGDPHTMSFTGLRWLCQEETQRDPLLPPLKIDSFDGSSCNLFPLTLPNPTSTQHKSLVGSELVWQQTLLLFQLTFGNSRDFLIFFHFYSKDVLKEFTWRSFHYLPQQTFLPQYERWLSI